MKGIIKNWKTSLFGLGALITGIAQIVSGDTPTGVIAILTALGLISAKDHDTITN
jgi:hypothetical protein